MFKFLNLSKKYIQIEVLKLVKLSGYLIEISSYPPWVPFAGQHKARKQVSNTDFGTKG